MTNKRVLLYITSDFSVQSVSKKCLEQIDAFKRLGFSVLYTVGDNEKIVLYDGNEKIPLLSCNSRSSRLCLTRFTFLRLSFILKKILRIRSVDIIYVRGYRFLLYSLFKKKNKLVIEIPTLEIEKEILGNKRLSLIKRLVYVARVKIAKVFCSISADCFINFQGVSEISKHPAFSISNCIDISNIPLKKVLPKSNADNTVNMIAVALMEYWQGYERIIKSLGEYKRRRGTNARKVRILLVGDGSEIPYYRKLVEEYGLQNDVEFCGYLSGKELDEVFDRADVALGGFGMYKIGVFSSSKLKIKEYCARGLPIVDASNDRAFTGKEEFVLQIPNDSSEIDMEEIVAFYDRVSQLPNLSQRIRKFCEENFDWTREFQRFFKSAFNWNLNR